MVGAGHAPAWINRHGLNHDAYVAALRADEADRQQASFLSAAAASGAGPHRAVSLADGLGSVPPDPAGGLSSQPLDWDEMMSPQRVAAAVAAANAAAREAALDGVTAAVRTSYDGLVVNAPQVLEMARSVSSGAERRPPLSPPGSFYRLPSPRTRSQDDEVSPLGSRASTPTTRPPTPPSRPPTPGTDPTGDPANMLSGFEAQRARLLAASARSAAAAAERQAAFAPPPLQQSAQHARAALVPPERSTSPFARPDSPAPRSLSGLSGRAAALLHRDEGSASVPLRRQYSGSSDGSALGLRLAALGSGSDHSGAAGSVSPSPSNADWAHTAGTLLDPLPVAAPVGRAHSAATAAYVPVSVFASSSAQRGGGDGGGVLHGGGRRGEQSTSPLSVSSCSSLSGRSISPPPRSREHQLPQPLLRQVSTPGLHTEQQQLHWQPGLHGRRVLQPHSNRADSGPCPRPMTHDGLRPFRALQSPYLTKDLMCRVCLAAFLRNRMMHARSAGCVSWRPTRTKRAGHGLVPGRQRPRRLRSTTAARAERPRSHGVCCRRRRSCGAAPHAQHTCVTAVRAGEVSLRRMQRCRRRPGL